MRTAIFLHEDKNSSENIFNRTPKNHRTLNRYVYMHMFVTQFSVFRRICHVSLQSSLMFLAAAAAAIDDDNDDYSDGDGNLVHLASLSIAAVQ